MLDDLRYALRFLARRRAFTLVAIVTVGLGVGANAAVFSLADAVLFRPLPYAHAERLFVLEPLQLSGGQNYGTMPVEDLEAARATGAFEAVMDLDQVGSIYVRSGDRVEPLRVQPVPPGYLAMLGVRPIYGRDFEERDADGNAVLLSYATWTGRYGSNVGLLDTMIPAVDGRAMHVIGVLPPSFRTASATAFFRPPDLLTAARPSYPPGSRAATPIVRLAEGISPAAAQARVSAIRGTDLKPGEVELRLIPLGEVMGRSSRSTLVLLCAVALLVLVVGCVNLANLVLARGAERRRELAVRVALGAEAWRVARLLLLETLVVAALGGVAGVAAAYWSFGALTAQLPASLGRSMAPAFDTRVFVFALGMAMAAGFAAGIVPAWRLARADATSGLQHGHLQPRPRAGRKALLVVEVGLAAVALVAALVLAESLADLVNKDLGFDARRLVVSVWSPGPGLASQDRATRAARLEQQLQSVRALPAVKSAAALTSLPASGAAADFLLFPRGQGTGGVYNVTAGFFQTMGIPLIEGRDLTDAESFAGASVGVLNQSAARVLFPDGHAIGRQVSAPRQPARTIVGVVADSRRSLKAAAQPTMYVPFDRAQFRRADVIVDAADTPAIREQIRVAINRVTPDTDVRVEPIEALLARESGVLRFTLTAIGGFAGLAVVLTMLGVYGVLAFIAGERVREYGVRVALGATRSAIGALVIRQALTPIGIGLGAGTIAAVWTSRILAAKIVDVLPARPVVFAAAAALLLACGAVAALLPARRAARVDPIVALRAE